jgi:tellurite resistance protein
MSENREEEKETKVVDRRRVDEFGQNREVQTEDAGAGFTLKESEAAVEPEINFMSFVVSLATQALMQMGQMSPPPGVDLKKDKNAARQTIEILAMLDAKTKGNLNKEESDMLEELLHNLRLSFLKM